MVRRFLATSSDELCVPQSAGDFARSAAIAADHRRLQFGQRIENVQRAPDGDRRGGETVRLRSACGLLLEFPNISLGELVIKLTAML